MDISSQLELANAKVTKLYVSEDPREKSSGWYLINFLGVKSTRNQAGVQDPMWWIISGRGFVNYSENRKQTT